jgi:hypothetical protein
MTIEPKLLSEEDIKFIGDDLPFSRQAYVPALLAHIAAMAEQIAAKDAEIERLLSNDARLNDTQALMKLVREVFYASPIAGSTGNLARAIQRYIRGLPRLSREEELLEYLNTLSAEERAEYWRQRNSDAALTPQPKDQSHG